MPFDPAATFEDNLARSEAECERLDPECVRILFDNLSALTRDGDAARNRQAKVDDVKALQNEAAAELDAMLPAIPDKAFKGER